MFFKAGVIVQALLMASLFYLGYSILNFTNAIYRVVDVYPKLIEDINKSAESLEIEQWLQVAQKIEGILPTAITLVDDLNKTANDVNQTIVSVDSKIPLILGEVEVIRNEALPTIIQSLDVLSSETVPNTLSEFKKYREDVIPLIIVESDGYRNDLIPKLISESKALRYEVPIIIAKADELVEKSKDISQDAAEGAIKGVILSPVNIIRDAKDGVSLKVEGFKQ